ncbi:MAG: hypothetical protein N3C12_01365 [Candidatus Binatia bacterium]|nr:hypothetical protein [Candidatus Binatia bacterium]
MKKVALVLLLTVSVAVGCGDDGETMMRPSGGIELGRDYRLELDPAAGTTRVWRGGRALVVIDLSGWQLGFVAQVDPGFNYDPYPLFVPNGLYASPAGLRWVSPLALEVVSRTATSVEARLRYPEAVEAQLLIQEEANGRFQIQWRPLPAPAVAYFRLRFLAPEEQGFYGLGEYFDDVNHRGKLRAMQIELDPELESFYNEAHVPVPFLIGSGGWGVLIHSYFPGVFDVQWSDPEHVDAVFGLGEASSTGLDLYLVAAASGLDVTRHYYEVTGFPRLPPPWVLGPLVWRDENRDQAQFEDDLEKMRELDLAATGVWIDRPYASAVNSFDFDPARFPDPERMFKKAGQLGYRVALWHTPYLDTRAEATRILREQAAARGFFPVRTGTLLNPWGRPLDFTNPDARSWWQGLLQGYRSLGVAGFKLDYGEDVVVGVSSQRNRWLFADGSDERTMHARYQLFYHQTYAEVLPPEGGLLLVRHSTLGGQAFGPVVWPGDLDASFARHRERVTEDGTTYVAVGGLPAAVVAGTGLGPSGFPLFASDTGGYRHSPPDKELFVRWFQHTALSPAMQIGTSTNDVAWEPTPENGFDEELLNWYRTYTRLHLRLFPYLWTYLQRLQQDGRAIQRPFGLVEPSLGEHPWDQYFLGDFLLVAPVVEHGRREREVLFPSGEWIEWWTGQRYRGPGRSTVPVPLANIPVFLAQGGIVPLLRPTIDTLVTTSDPERVDSYATSPGTLYARVFPGGRTAFRVFDGTRLEQAVEVAPEGDRVRLRYAPGSDFRRGAIVECLGLPVGAVRSVHAGERSMPELGTMADLESQNSGWRRDGEQIWVRLSPETTEAEITLGR